MPKPAYLVLAVFAGLIGHIDPLGAEPLPTQISLTEADFLKVQNIEPDLMLITHGLNREQFGYIPAREDAQARGPRDFAIDQQGRVVVLDTVKRRVVRLGKRLAFENTWSAPKSLRKVFWNSDRLVFVPFVGEQFCLDDAQTALLKTGPTRPKPAPSVRAIKLDPRSFLVLGKAQANFRWQLAFERDVLAVYPLPGSGKDQRVFLRVDFIVSPAPLRLDSEVYVIAVDGTALARLQLRPPGEARLLHDAKAGPDGSVIQLCIEEQGTEVLRWQLAD